MSGGSNCRGSSATPLAGMTRSRPQGWVADTGFSTKVGGVSFPSWLRTKGAGVSGVGSSPVTFRSWCRRVALGIEEHSSLFLSAFFRSSRGWLGSRLRTHSRASLWGERDKRETRNHENRMARFRFSWYTGVMIERAQWLSEIRSALRRSRVVALLGPRQSGKTTLAREIVP